MKPLGIAALCLLTLSRALAAPPLWGDLEPGPHPVGFDAYWIADPARTYQRPETDPAPTPRPILVNIWYPARATDAAPMPHAGYLTTARDAPAGSLATDLAAYEREVIAAEVFGSAPEDLDPAAPTPAQARLNQFLQTPTGAARATPREPGPHPLVLYHAGYGSSFEDNAVLCEFLASHGYIVAGSAFLDGTGESFNIDAETDSARDLEALIREACDKWGADPQRIGLVGHSGGAHTGFRFIAQHNDPIRAFVSLDTTQDYHSFADPRWDDFVPLVLDNADDITTPVLFAARQHALFRMGDRMLAAPRCYLTFRDLQHNSFIAQGVLAAEFAPASDTEPDAPQLRAEYDELCRAVLLFLDANLRASRDADDQLHTRWAGASLGTSPVVAEFAAPGQGPAPYDEHADAPPTPRQMAAIIDAGRTDVAADLLQRFADDPRAKPFAEPEFAVSVVFQLVREGRTGEARAMLDRFPTGPDPILHILNAYQSLYTRVGATKLADAFAEAVKQLSPPERPSE